MKYRALTIDGSYLARSRFEASGSLFGGFMDKLMGLRKVYNPMLTFVAWDSPSGSSPRKKKSSDYKAKRKAPPSEYLGQVDTMQQILYYLGVPQFSAPDGEGDDVIATISRQWPGPHLLWSADKDLLQLVAPGVHFLKHNPSSREDTLITPETIKDTPVKINGTTLSGFDADEWLSLQAIIGDSVDGVPGVKGVGPKGAAQAMGAIRRVDAQIMSGAITEPISEEKFTSLSKKEVRVVNKLIEHREDLAKSYELIKLSDVELDIVNPCADEQKASEWLAAEDIGWVADEWWSL